jgi:hypothetical protein
MRSFLALFLFLHDVFVKQCPLFDPKIVKSNFLFNNLLAKGWVCQPVAIKPWELALLRLARYWFAFTINQLSAK